MKMSQSFVSVVVTWVTWALLATTVVPVRGFAADPVIPPPPPAPPAGGFQPGNQPFANPFATPPADELEEDEIEVAPAPIPAPGNRPSRPVATPSGKGISVGGQKDPNDVPSPKKAVGKRGVEVGGEPPSGVVSGNEFNPLAVDSVTGLGAGGKEVITDFNYPDADILDLAKTIGKLTGKNFIFEKSVKGRISIVSNGAITVGDAWRAFLTALDINGFALIPSGKYIRISRARDARDKQVDTFVGNFTPDTDALITKVFALKYINSDDVARTLRSFMPASSRIIPYAQTNTLIVTDTGSNVLKLAKMLEFLDIEGFDAGIEVIRVKFASAVEIQKLIDKLIPDATRGTTGRPGGAPFGGGGAFAARKTKAGGVINTIIADDRTNALIIHANSQGVKEVKQLISKLDRKVALSTAGGRIHVVYLQHADSKTMAETLNKISQGGKTPTAPKSGTGIGENPTEGVIFQGDIKVASDDTTNSLVITAAPGDFDTLQRVIAKLDIPRDEVYVEAVIMEVSLGRQFEFSSGVAMPVGTTGLAGLIPGTDLLSFLSNPASQRGLVMGFGVGSDRTLTIGGQSVAVKDVNGLIRAISTNSKTNILATPQIMTLDNVEAIFETSEHIPVEKATASNGVIVKTTDKEKVTLSLKIKPQIKKASNFVKLVVDTQMEDITKQNVPSALEGTAFGKFSRQTKTEVVIADGDTVVLGGLIRDKKNEQVSKVPILGDIPLLGWLFRDKREQIDKTNLLIFITPHIIRNYDKVRTVMDKKLQERDDFLQKNTGGDDPQREKRDDIIRNLPDIQEIMRRQDQKAVIPQTQPAKPEAKLEPKLLEEEQKVPAPAAAPVANPDNVAPPDLFAPPEGGSGALPGDLPDGFE